MPAMIGRTATATWRTIDGHGFQATSRRLAPSPPDYSSSWTAICIEKMKPKYATTPATIIM